MGDSPDPIDAALPFDINVRHIGGGGEAHAHTTLRLPVNVDRGLELRPGDASS